MPEKTPLDKPASLEAELQKYLKAYSSDPKSRAFAPLGETYRKMGKLDEAIGILEGGVKIHPNYALAHLTLGRCLSEKGDSKGALARYEDAIRYAPDSIMAHKLLAAEYKKLKDDDSLLKTYKRLVKIAPQDQDAVSYLSAKGLYELPKRKPHVEEKPGEFEIKTPVETKPGGSDPAEMKPGPPEIPSVKAPEVGKKEELPESLGQGRIEPSTARPERQKLEFYTMTLAGIYLKQGMIKEAEEIYETLLKGDPQNSIYMNALSRLKLSAVKPAPSAPLPEQTAAKAKEPEAVPPGAEPEGVSAMPEAARLESLLGLIKSRKRAL